MANLLVVSSDGHVAARMSDYTDYIEPAYRDEFRAFLEVYKREGVPTTDPGRLKVRLDEEVFAEWEKTVQLPGRLDSYWSAERRVQELDREGIAGEVLFHDFATPFVMSSPTRAASIGLEGANPDQLAAGYRAYNRWVADFIRYAPHRWAPMAAVTLDDVDAAVRDLAWCKDHGFAGCALPAVPDSARLYTERYEPFWRALVDLDLVVNIHVAIANDIPAYTGAPSATSAQAMVGSEIIHAVHRVLPVLIFSGTMERYPTLKFVFTEQHSDWVIGALARMEHSYRNSDLKRDIRDIIPRAPLEYWDRQCYLGSSVFSRAEVAERKRIGLDKMMMGIDFPHAEGAWRHGTRRYIRATFGAEQVPVDEAEKMLGLTACDVFQLSVDDLVPVRDSIGPESDEVLHPFDVQPDLRGDLNRPLVTME